MKQSLLLIVVLSFLATFSYSQDAEALYQEGIELHEAGEYQAAIRKYEQALKILPDHPRITYVMAYAYQVMGNYSQAQGIAEKGIKANKKSDETADLYLIAGNCQLFQEKFGDALKTYKKALKQYPDYYMLHFSTGLTHYSIGETESDPNESYEKARRAFERAIKLEPGHSASHYYLAFMVDHFGMKIPTLMTISRYLALEPEGERSEYVYPFLGKLLTMNPEADENNAFNLLLNGDIENKEDNFMVIDMSLQLISVASSTNSKDGEEEDEEELDDDNPLPDLNDMTYLEQFSYKFDFFCEQLKNSSEGDSQKGFFWEEYTPYFVALLNAGHVETFSHIINLNHEDHGEEVIEWVEDNEGKVEAFFTWQQEYMKETSSLSN